MLKHLVHEEHVGEIIREYAISLVSLSDTFGALIAPRRCVSEMFRIDAALCLRRTDAGRARGVHVAFSGHH